MYYEPKRKSREQIRYPLSHMDSVTPLYLPAENASRPVAVMRLASSAYLECEM